MRKLMAALVLAALVVACTDQATAPEQQQTPAIAADFTNNPDGGGAVVDRWEQGNWFAFWRNMPTLPASTVRAYHTTFPLSWYYGAAWDDAVCGPANPTSGAHFQEVAHWDHFDPNDVWIQNGVADVWIVLVDLTSSGPCAARPVIASGWGKMRYTDNNVTSAWGGHAPGIQDTWTFRAQGRLTMAATGRVVQYNGLYHCVVPMPFDVPRCNYEINF
jgi:hypothetical protein